MLDNEKRNGMRKLVFLCMLSGVLFAHDVDYAVVALKNSQFESALSNLLYAANQGDKIAQQNLGVIYNNGIGVAKDKVKAAHWFNKASGQGDVIMASK